MYGQSSQARLNSLDRNDETEQKYGRDVYGQSGEARLSSLDRTDDLW